MWNRLTCALWTCTRWNVGRAVLVMGELLNEDVVPAYRLGQGDAAIKERIANRDRRQL